MTQLWRLRYLRLGRERTITFGAQDLIAAMEFYELWQIWPGVAEVLEMSSLPPSRFGARVVGGAEEAR